MSSTESMLAQQNTGSAFSGVRARFASLPRLAYLNSGSYGLLADVVQGAIEEYVALRVETGADWDAWVGRSFVFAANMARLTGADPAEIAVTASTSSGINSLASALDFSGPRNRVLVSNYEFPTSGQIWHAQTPRGAIVEHVAEADDGRIPLEHFERAIDERTRIVALSRVCYRHGGKLLDDEVRAIVAMAHRHGALVILDCFQSLGAETLDVKALGVDFAVGGTYKYLLGTSGIGYLYARGELADRMVPTMSGWFAQERTGDMNIFANEPGHGASRFQAGTPPVLSCYASNAGLDLIAEIGPEAIAAHVRMLTAEAIARFRDAGFGIATPLDAHGPMIALRAAQPETLVQRLIDRQIVASQRDGNIRFGFHFYNDSTDIDRLLAALTEHRDLLG